MKKDLRDRRLRFAIGVPATVWLCAMLLIPPAAAAVASADVETTNSARAIGEWYALGGWVMHLLVICSALVLGVVAERLWALRSSITIPGRLERALIEASGRGDHAACRTLCESRHSALSRVTAAIIEGHAVGTDESRERLALVGGYEVRRLHGNLDLLAGLANIATMLGLLGTVLGMISAFGTIAEVGTSDARVVAGGIFEALVTTAAGLVIGVTALACHTHLVRRAESITTRIEAVAASLIDGTGPPADVAPEAREPRTTRLVGQVG